MRFNSAEDNKLSSIPTEIASMTSLTSLYLRKLCIIWFDTTHGIALTQSRKAHLSAAALLLFETVFPLNVVDNELSFLPSEIGLMTSLVIIDSGKFDFL